MTLVPSRINSYLEERSQLSFEFPNGETRVLPFFSNIEIQENKKANYAKYQPVGRSSPMFSYVGSDARQFNLNFKIFLPHVHEHISKGLYSITFPRGYTEKISRSAFTREKKEDYNIKNSDVEQFQSEFRELNKHLLFKHRRDATFLDSLDSLGEAIFNGSRGIDRSISALAQLPFNTMVTYLNALLPEEIKTINFIAYWINLIRLSVVNNSQRVNYGPPVIRVKHGILYQDVPCICLGYKVSNSEDAGYETNSMLPRQIDVSLDLAELRQGNFGKHEPAKPVSRDNISGWEVIFDSGPNSMDPLPIRK